MKINKCAQCDHTDRVTPGAKQIKLKMSAKIDAQYDAAFVK